MIWLMLVLVCLIGDFCFQTPVGYRASGVSRQAMLTTTTAGRTGDVAVSELCPACVVGWGRGSETVRDV